MENLSLKELKAQNATPEEVKEDLPVIDIKENITPEQVNIDNSSDADTNNLPGELEESSEEKVLESWMQTEESETSEDDQNSGFVPNHEAAKRRRQAKALKGELSEAKDENQVLLDRIAQLEASNNAPKKQNEIGPRPTREDFDFDDDAYDEAVDKWNDDKFDRKMNNHYQDNQQKSQKEAQELAQQQALDKSLNDHYDRAQKLVDSKMVTQEAYQGADKMVRMSMENMFQGHGNQMTDRLISTLNGEGSEKVIYQLGVNPGKMQELTAHLQNDPSGLSAAAFLGRLQSQIQSPQKRRSQAPTPGAKVDGESGSSGKAGTLQKQYSKSTDIQERISLKRQAKKQGVNVNNW